MTIKEKTFEAVISGIGGRFPKSNNITEFSENIVSGGNLLQPITRWNPGWPGASKIAGETGLLEYFDYSFFGVHRKLAECSDPMVRISLETAFEALVDAGVNPSTIRDTNAHVYAATFQLEGDGVFLQFLTNKDGYNIMGRNQSMLANRISYWLNLSGHSSAYNAGHGWIGIGLALARDAIRSGECETAFVFGHSFSLLKEMCKTKQMFGLLSVDDSCAPYDIKANGVVRGEALVCFLVQRKDIAKRSYGSIECAGSSSQGPLPNWFLSINEDHLRQYVSSMYRDHGIDPNKVRLLEADGFCNKEMVEAELKIMDEILNSRRPKDKPLILGSVKTLVGDTEGAGGHVGLTKLLLAMDTGVIAPTLECDNINPNIRGLVEGRFKVLDTPTKWDVTPDTHVAFSCISTSGVVGHVVVKAHDKVKSTDVKENYHIPHIVLMSGRTQEVVGKSLQKVMSSRYDPEYLRMVQEFFTIDIDHYEWRGYGFRGSKEFVVQRKNRRPVWFVYSGMGSQWPGMARELASIPIVKETFERLHKCLESKGLNLMQILTSRDQLFENILHSFVGITAVQIALTNLVTQLGIVPDGLIGHSLGELGCSYADGCLTEEQTLLASYARGIASLKADLVPGLMAAVGLGYAAVKEMLPPDVYVACHNSKDSATLSGPTSAMDEVIESFKEQNIFVKGVNVSNIAYHSPYIRPAAPYLRQFLDEEGAAHIPENAVVIEIAPHGLLQAILKKSLGSEAVSLSLTRRGTERPVNHLLETFGKLFLEGLSPKLWKLYPEVSMPVSRNTPSLTPLITWESERFPIFYVPPESRQNATYVLSSLSPYMEISGVRRLLPSFTLIKAREVIAAAINEEINTLSLVFEDVHFYDMISLKNDEKSNMMVSVLPLSGFFVIFVDGELKIKGNFKVLDKEDIKRIKLPSISKDIMACLDADDVSAEMKSRCMVDSAQCIKNIEIYGDDWIAEIECNDITKQISSMFSMLLLWNRDEYENPAYIHHIQQLVIDPQSEIPYDKVRLNTAAHAVICGGIELYRVGLKCTDRTNAKMEPFSLCFVPYGETNLENDQQFLSHVIHLSFEKHLIPVTAFRICDFDGELSSLASELRHIANTQWHYECELVSEPRDAMLVLCGPTSISAVAPVLRDEGNLLLSRFGRVQRKSLEETLSSRGLYSLAEQSQPEFATSLVVATAMLPSMQPNNYKIIKMGVDDYVPNIIPDVYDLIIFVWEKGCHRPIEKLFGQVASLQCAAQIRLVFLMSPSAPSFALNLPLYADQIRRNCPINIYMDGKWGGYRLLPLMDHSRPRTFEDIVIGTEPMTNSESSFKLRCVGLETHRRSCSDLSSLIYSGALDYSGELENKKRIMGLGYYDKSSGYVQRDPYLVWTVPSGWSLEDAATVPCAYALMYYSLCELISLRAGDAIMVTCPVAPAGQAAVRISLNAGLDVYVLAKCPQEQDCIRKLFPKLKFDHILAASSTFVYRLLKVLPKSLKAVVSDLHGRELNSNFSHMRSTKLSPKWLQIGEDAMHNFDRIGMQAFVDGGHFYGVTEQRVLRAPIEVKKKIAAWVRKGLDDNVICPYHFKTTYSLDQFHENLRAPTGGNASKVIVCLGDTRAELELKERSTLENSVVIVGDTRAQWIRIAHWLARKGCKAITLYCDQPSSSLVTRHAHILHKNHQSKLTAIRKPDNGAELVDQVSNKVFVEAILVFAQSKLAEEVVNALGSRGLHNTQVVLFNNESSHFSTMCERWCRDGLKVRAALVVEDIPGYMESRLLSWCLTSAAPPVCAFNGPAFIFEPADISLDEVELLPSSIAELRAMGARLNGKTQPTFRELTSRCKSAQYTTEIAPVFFINGLHGTADEELKTLASSLLCPIFEVSLPANTDSLEASACAIVQGIQKIQPRGPYNLAGDAIRTYIVVEIAHILEDKGQASAIMVLDNEIHLVREKLKSLQQSSNFDLHVLKCMLKNDVSNQFWKTAHFASMTWKEKVSAALSTVHLDEESRGFVATALDHAKRSLDLLTQGKRTIKLNHGIVHSLRKGNKEYGESEVEHRYFNHFIPASKLKSKEIGDIIGPNVATPVIQLDLVKDQALRQAALVEKTVYSLQ